jgi:hypothetical protein
MNVEEHPPPAVAGLAALEGSVDGKAGWNSPRALVKEPGVAGLQLGDKLVHFLFESLRVLNLQDPLGTCVDNGIPVRTVQLWIEMFGVNKPAHLLEYRFAVLAG